MDGIPMSGAYLDDILASGKSDQDHLKTLKTIFQRMRESNYYLSKSKCEFMKSHVEFLGHILSEKGVHTSPKKIEAIECIQRPVNLTELQSFLGFC